MLDALFQFLRSTGFYGLTFGGILMMAIAIIWSVSTSSGLNLTMQ